MPVDPRRQQQLFEQALDRPPAERAAFLDRACGSDGLLRQRVGALLDALAAASDFLAEPSPRTVGGSEAPGSVIDRYRLLQRIGEGGFGTVWMAEQEEPVRRRVALKVIKLGMDTRQVVARFEAERQALALMDHPNIAVVHDGGTTPGGRPYFVMELVNGVPITDYCDRAALGATARLELFQQVCYAVQHAHQKGVIHRDLKPSNILVTLHDGVSVPKVIDFGVAKATSAELTQKTLFTEFRQMIGTPEYMAPEQAELSGLDVDTRADVYSLGVLLYELLTGTKPFDLQSALDKGYTEMLRVIREVEPPKPSTRVGKLGGQLVSAARQRQTTPAMLSRSLRGDIDWIVMKALEKDRSRRYATAKDFAADIDRHLRHEPVDAGPPGAAYRLRKFARRNRASVIAGAMVATALLLGVVGTGYGLARALVEQQNAEEEAARATKAAAEAAAAAVAEADAKAEAQDNEHLAKAAARRAEQAAGTAEAVIRFVIDTLDSGDPELTAGSKLMTIVAAMDKAVRDIGSGRFRDDPETEARLQYVIARILGNNGQLRTAEPLFAQALTTLERLHPDDHEHVCSALINLGLVRLRLGNASEAERLLLRADEMARRLYPGDHRERAACLANLALVRTSQGRLREAEDLATAGLEMMQRLNPGDDPAVINGLINVAWSWFTRGDVAAAEPLFARAVGICEQHYLDGHPALATSLNGLAMVRSALGRNVEAEALLVRALSMDRELYQGDHPLVARSLSNLGLVRQRLGRLSEAEPLFLDALAMEQRLQTGDHERMVKTLNNLARVCTSRAAGIRTPSRCIGRRWT